MLKNKFKKNYYDVNILIVKGMQKRRRMSSASILNIVDNKPFMRVVK